MFICLLLLMCAKGASGRKALCVCCLCALYVHARMLTQERHMCKHTPLQRQAQMWAFMTLLSDDGELALQDRLVGPTEKLNDMPLGSAMELSGRVYHAGDLVFSSDGMLASAQLSCRNMASCTLSCSCLN